MKPTKEQLEDPKWWDANSDNAKYCYRDRLFSCIVFRSTEYLGRNYELLAKRPEPEHWVPEVGVECCGNTTDAAGIWSWQKVEPLKDMGNGEFACYTEKKILRFVDQLRPIKTQREELIDLVTTALQTDDQDVTELCNKSKSMFMSGATKSVDAILARFDLTEKDGE